MFATGLILSLEQNMFVFTFRFVQVGGAFILIDLGWRLRTFSVTINNALHYEIECRSVNTGINAGFKHCLKRLK